MRKTLISLGLLAVGLLGLTVHGDEGRTPTTDDGQAIRKAVAAYGDAINKGDLAALSAAWAPDAEYIDEKGSVTRGHDAIVALFKQYLADLKGSRIAFKVSRIRSLTGDVALQDGTSTITQADGSLDEGRFTAVWVKKDGKWLIQNARDLPATGDAPGASGALKELQWMVGDWEGAKGGVQVSVQWTLNQAFLSQKYQVKGADGDLLVMQLVGFDPLTGQIKSWTFDSHGGYGEGLWARDGNAWVVETAGVLANGETGTAVNIIRYVDDHNAVFQARDREVGGQPIPDSEVKLVRKAEKK
jgi:uncharacterized protein (TIGR02246 family)